MSTIKLDKYVVAGEVSYADLEFLDFDSASGGYPCAANCIRNVYITPLDAWKDLPEATSDYVRMKDPKVYRIVLEEVDMTSYERDQDRVDVTNTGLISIYHNLANAAIGAAEPCPEHSEWNAAIEAAAEKVAIKCDARAQYSLGQSIRDSIRALKKGTPQ